MGFYPEQGIDWINQLNGLEPADALQLAFKIIDINTTIILDPAERDGIVHYLGVMLERSAIDLATDRMEAHQRAITSASRIAKQSQANRNSG